MKSPTPRSGRTGAQVKAIESLSRGLAVLSHVQRHFASSLKDIHEQTGVPKASLLRILKTLEASGRVVRRLADGAYMPREAVSFLDARSRERVELALTAAPFLLGLKSKLPWPSDIGVRDGLEMMTLESNDSAGELEVNRRIISYRPDMVRSAMGRAYLAFCDVAEREELLRAPANLRGMRRAALLAELSATRARAYSIRDPASIGPNGDERHAQSAIAVPIFAHRRLIACLNCVWLAKALPVDEAVRRYLALLQQAAQGIGAAMQAKTPAPGSAPPLAGDTLCS